MLYASVASCKGYMVQSISVMDTQSQFCEKYQGIFCERLPIDQALLESYDFVADIFRNHSQRYCLSSLSEVPSF